MEPNCYCGVAAEGRTTEKTDEEYWTCAKRAYNNDTKKFEGGCEFFVFVNDYDETKKCACGDLWIPLRQKKYAFCRNKKCNPHNLVRVNRIPIWEEFELGEEFQFKKNKQPEEVKEPAKVKPKTNFKKSNFKKTNVSK